VFEVIEDLVDHPRILNATDDFHDSATGAAGINVDPEDAFLGLCQASSMHGVRPGFALSCHPWI
jgi:hypothetical protein